MAAHPGRRRALALGLGVLLAPIAFEVGYRVLRSTGLSPTTNPAYVVHDERLGWRYEPGRVERHRSGEFDVEVRINAQGFRGQDWPRPSSRPRVLVVGDSYAFGWGVTGEDALCARLQEQRPDWDVLCAAVSGYGTDQEVLLVERLMPEWQPALVVVVFCENDLYESASDVVYGKSKPRFARVGEGLILTGVPVPMPWLERASHAWRALRKARWERDFALGRRDPNAEWALVSDLLRRLCGSLDGRPLVVVSDRDELVRLAQDEIGIEHVDTRPHLGSGDLRFPTDGHWNARGHDAVARALAEALRPMLP